MVIEGKTINRYSDAFKRKLIEDIESGRLTRVQAKQKYGLNNQTTIGRWIKQFGKKHLLSRIVRIEMPDEKQPQEIIKQLQAEKQQLESALAKTQLKLICMESLVEVAEEHYKIDIKQKFGTGQPSEVGKKLKISKSMAA